MGQLSRLKIPTATITVAGDQQITFRGINVPQLTVLLAENGKDATVLFAMVMAQMQAGKTLGTEMAAALGMEALKAIPNTLARVIAMAADDDTPEGVAAAGQLVVSDQIACLEAIFGLTLYTEEAAKKVLEVVAKAAGAVAGLVTTPSGLK